MPSHPPFDKIADATFTPDRMGLIWVESAERERYGFEEHGLWYTFWLLVEPGTDRIMATLDGPTADQICYNVAFEGGSTRKFLSEEGAKRYALAMAINTLTEERAIRSYARKCR